MHYLLILILANLKGRWLAGKCCARLISIIFVRWVTNLKLLQKGVPTGIWRNFLGGYLPYSLRFIMMHFHMSICKNYVFNVKIYKFSTELRSMSCCCYSSKKFMIILIVYILCTTVFGETREIVELTALRGNLFHSFKIAPVIHELPNKVLWIYISEFAYWISNFTGFFATLVLNLV